MSTRDLPTFEAKAEKMTRMKMKTRKLADGKSQCRRNT
jgi:hypothetical protein